MQKHVTLGLQTTNQLATVQLNFSKQSLHLNGLFLILFFIFKFLSHFRYIPYWKFQFDSLFKSKFSLKVLFTDHNTKGMLW